jgi:uncharacterized protein (TIGR03066 family)
MKLATKLAKLQQRKHRQDKPGRPQGRTFGLRGWAWVALCLTVAGAGTFAVFEFFIWNKVPPALVGKWQVEEGPEYGGTFEFSRHGTLEVRLKSQGQEFNLKSRVTVKGKTLRTTPQNSFARQEETRQWTILELTADSLILEMENGQVLKMVRAT